MTVGNRLASLSVRISSISSTLLDCPPKKITLYGLAPVKSGNFNGIYSFNAFNFDEHGHSIISRSPFGSRNCIRAFGSVNLILKLKKINSI